MPVVTEPFTWRQRTTDLFPQSFGGAANVRCVKSVPDCTDHRSLLLQ